MGEPFEVSFTRQARHMVDPRGSYAVEHAYVQYFIPESRRPGPPVVLVHGGGMTGACWETTPDGRAGWLHLLLQDGYEVHVIDNVERGRAGFAPGLWDGDPLLRSMQEAWTLFRIGPPNGFAARRAYPGQQFPVAAFDAFARSFVPRWLNTTPLQVEALIAVLDRIGPAQAICHSQGAEVVFDALERRPDMFAGVTALEPSNLPDPDGPIVRVPFVLASGDFLDADAIWSARADAWHQLAEGLIAQSAPCRVVAFASNTTSGNSHMMMMDANSPLVLAACQEALTRSGTTLLADV